MDDNIEDCGCRSRSLTCNDYTVGWICALPKEQTAATAILDSIHADLPKPPDDPNTYTLGCVGKHKIVIACLPKGKIGTNSAATFATQMARTFPSIRIGLMVGIGGGIPPKVELGDVVISAPVDQYQGVVQWDFGKAELGGKFRRVGSLNGPPSALLTALTKMETRSRLSGNHIPQYLDTMGRKWPNLVPEYSKPPFPDGSYMHPRDSRDESQNIIALLWDMIITVLGYILCWQMVAPVNHSQEPSESDLAQRQRKVVHVHHGLIASGNQVIKDAQVRDSLDESLGGNLLCVEMEAAGLMNDFPCVVIRGICDYADSQKSKQWQEYAASVAAACAKELLEYVQSSDLAAERPLKEVLDQVHLVHGSVERTEHRVKKLSSKFDRKEDVEILNWFSVVNYGHQQSDLLRMQQPGTGQWFLESSAYRNWQSSPGQTLFCPGIPGAGKTVMTAIVVDDLYKQFLDDQTQTTGVAYIYCSFQRQADQHIDSMVASLLMQLVRCQPSVPDSVLSLYARHKRRGTRPSFTELSKALSSVAALFSRVFIIVDALDECQAYDGRVSKFLSEIFELQRVTGVNFFATSRPIPVIEEQFDGHVSQTILATTHDLEVFLGHHTTNLPGFVLEAPALRMEIKDQIIQAAEGMFLLAKLHLDSLIGRKSVKDLRIALQKLPKGSDAYDRAYDGAMSRIQGQVPSSRDLAEQTLVWITRAKRPLSVLELQHALAVELGSSDLDEDNLSQVTDILSVCTGLVTVDEESNIIRLVHYTTQEYFERSWKRWFVNAEIDIANVCVAYLLFRSFETGPCQSRDELHQRLEDHKFYDYSAKNWGFHAHDAVDSCPEILQLLSCQPKLNASTQVAMGARRKNDSSSRYFPAPKETTSLHVAAYFGAQELVKMMLERHIPINSQDEYGQTPLAWAAENGHDGVVRFLLQNGANVEATDNDGRTPLSWAAENGHEAVIRLLLDEGADIETRDNETTDGVTFSNAGIFLVQSQSRRTPLFVAAGKGHEAAVRLLIDRGADRTARSKSGTTAMAWAAEHGHGGVAKLLIEHGASIEENDVSHAPKQQLTNGLQLVAANAGLTPLAQLAKNGHEAAVKMLLDQGSDIEAKDVGFQRPPLVWAARNGHIAVVKLLLDEGANKDATDKGGKTALHWAAENGLGRVIELLIDRGADINATDGFGSTPLTGPSLGHNASVTMLLLANGADVNIPTKDGWTALHKASRYGFLEICNILLQVQASKEQTDREGRTPLFLASQNGHTEVVRSLLEDGANTERANDYGWMPLHAAYYGGHVEIMQLLLGSQADINAGDKMGFAPLHLASFHGNLEIVRILLENKADVNVGDKMGLRPLHAASMHGHPEVVRLLLQVPGASFDVNDDDFRTPLFFAAAKGHSEVVQLLLSYSAKLNMNDRYGTTPLGAAIRNGQEETVRILLPLADSTAYFEDGLSRNLAWWATKSGCSTTLHLVQQWAQKMGIEIHESDLNVEYLLMPPMVSEKWCDVCTRTIPSILAYYRCESCAGIDICLECHELGAQCRDVLHEWSLHDANGEQSGQKEGEKEGEKVHAVYAQEEGQEKKKLLRISFEGNWTEEGARAIKQEIL